MIKQYDEVILKNGKSAVIVEIFEDGVAYEADVEIGKNDWETKPINFDDIKYVIEKIKRPIKAIV